MQLRIVQMKHFLGMAALGAVAAVAAQAQSVNTTITRALGDYSRTTVVTGAGGKTATYQNNANWGNGFYNDSRTRSGFNGKTTNYQSNATWGNGSYTDTRSYTGRNGGTRSDTVVRSGGVVTNSFTGRNGNTRTYSRPARFRR